MPDVSSQQDSAFRSMMKRGVAYLIDCSCVFLMFAVTQLAMFTPLRALLGIDNEWFRSGINTQLYTLLTISLPVWLYFALLESSRWQATLGKRVLGLQVADQQTRTRIGLVQSLVRTIIKLLPWEIAHLANNLPQPIWYVETPGFRIGFALSGILMGIWIAAVWWNPRRQGIHDRVARTLVESGAAAKRESVSGIE